MKNIIITIAIVVLVAMTIVFAYLFFTSNNKYEDIKTNTSIEINQNKTNIEKLQKEKEVLELEIKEELATLKENNSTSSERLNRLTNLLTDIQGQLEQSRQKILDCTSFSIAELYTIVREIAIENPNAKLIVNVDESVTPTIIQDKRLFEGDAEWTWSDTERPYYITNIDIVMHLSYIEDMEVSFFSEYSNFNSSYKHGFKFTEDYITYIERAEGTSGIGNLLYLAAGNYNVPELPSGITIKLVY